jgi:hypothetical protein
VGTAHHPPLDYGHFFNLELNSRDLLCNSRRMNETHLIQGRLISPEDIEQIRALMIENPKWHLKGIRFVQFSVLLPLLRISAVGARAVPLSFEPVDQPTKSGKKASDQEKAAYLKACKKTTCANKR